MRDCHDCTLKMSHFEPAICQILNHLFLLSLNLAVYLLHKWHRVALCPMNVILDVVGDSVLKLFDEYEHASRHRNPSTRLSRENRRDRILSEKKFRDRSTGRDALKRTVSSDSSYVYTVSSSSMTETLGATTATSFAGRTAGTSVAQSTIGSREGLWLKHQRSSSVSRTRVPLSSSVVAPTNRRREVSFDTVTPGTKMKMQQVVPKVPVDRPANATHSDVFSQSNLIQRAGIEPKHCDEGKACFQGNSAARAIAEAGKQPSFKSDEPVSHAMPSQEATPRPESDWQAIPPTQDSSAQNDQPARETLGTNNETPSLPPSKDLPHGVQGIDESFVASSKTPQMSHRKHKHRFNTHPMTSSAQFQPIIEEGEAESNEELIARVDDLVARVQEAEQQGRLYMQELKKLQLELKDLNPSEGKNNKKSSSRPFVPAEVVEGHRLGRSRARNAAGVFQRDARSREHWCTNIIPESFATCGRIFRSQSAENAYYSSEPPIVYRESRDVYRESRDVGDYYNGYGHPMNPSLRDHRVMYHQDYLMVPHLDYAEAEPVRWTEQNPRHYHQPKQQENFHHQHGISNHQAIPPHHVYGSGTRQHVGANHVSGNNRFAQFYGDRSMLSSVGAEVPTDAGHAAKKSFEGRTIVIYPRMGNEQSKGEAGLHPRHPSLQNTA